MEPKKTTKANLENKRITFLQVGLVISLAIVFSAFNLNSSVKTLNSLGEMVGIEVENEIVPVTIHKPPPPPLPPPKIRVFDAINIVDNYQEIPDDFFFPNYDTIIFTNIGPRFDPETVDNNHIVYFAEQMPVFPGGDAGLLNWIANNLKYPATAANNNVQGVVNIRFIVNTDGNVSDAQIIRGVHPSLDNEAMSVIGKMPKWKPGLQNGVPVGVYYTVPIRFQLQ